MELPAQASVHGPYEDAIIAGCRVIEKLIDGQSPDQRQQIWQSLIALGKPFVDMAAAALKIAIVTAPENKP